MSTRCRNCSALGTRPRGSGGDRTAAQTRACGVGGQAARNQAGIPVVMASWTAAKREHILGYSPGCRDPDRQETTKAMASTERLLPTGECWCGCGSETTIGSFFLPGQGKLYCELSSWRSGCRPTR